MTAQPPTPDQHPERVSRTAGRTPRCNRPARRFVDVVIVGGGIAGSALATVLAREGLAVTVLERSRSYKDKVRGEVISCWGVAELQQLDLADVLLQAEGCYVPRAVSYDETTNAAEAEQGAAMLDQMLPGVPGTLNVGHPQACDALTAAAVAAGADVVRGARSIVVDHATTSVVTYQLDGTDVELLCRMVVGADGRLSSVRKQLGIELHQSTPRTMCGGMLVENLTRWPAHCLGEGTEGDLHYYVLPRTGGRVRLYLMHDIRQKGRFIGPQGPRQFLDSFGFACIPGSDMFAAARVAGPCVFYPMNDAWTAQPHRPGAVLVGDAAGWNDPIIGQGLSIALRDVRMVAQALLGDRYWNPSIFAPYASERLERMRRLRVTAAIKTHLVATFTPEGLGRRRAYNNAWRDNELLTAPQLAPLVGPEKVPAELFSQRAVDTVLALH